MLDLLSTKTIVLLVLGVGTIYGILFIRVIMKVNVRQETNYSRFESLEYKLVYPIDQYTCYSSVDNGRWVPADYETLCSEIIGSPSIVFSGMIPQPDYGIRYSLELDRDSRIIYVALGNDSYDWNSIHSPLNSQGD